MSLSDDLWYTDENDMDESLSRPRAEVTITKEVTTNIQPPPVQPPVQQPPPVVIYQNPNQPVMVQSTPARPSQPIPPTAYRVGDRDQIPAAMVQMQPKRKTVYYWPFIIYLILSAIVLLGFIFSKRGMGETVTYVLLQIVWIVIIGFIIYWLCKSGKVGWAWFVLFLPLIIQIVWVVLAAIFPN